MKAEASRNIKIVQRFFEARNRGDRGWLDYVDPEAEFDLSESRSPYRGLYRGHDEIHEQWEAMREAWAEAEMRPEDPVAAGDQVVVAVRISARGRTSGVELEGQGANAYTLKDGKDSALQALPDQSRGPGGGGSDARESEALAAAGVTQ